MGVEISTAFLLIPVLLMALDVILMVLKRDVVIHLILLLLGLLMLGSLMLNSYLDGFHPQQGLIIGSVLYLPAYFLTWAVLSGISARITQSKLKQRD
jgi:hypothetical protein